MERETCEEKKHGKVLSGQVNETGRADIHFLKIYLQVAPKDYK